MFQFLALCLLSYPTSKVMNCIIFFRLLKDLCDQGYTIDFESVSKMDGLLGSSNIFTQLSKLPLFNIFGSFFAGYTYQSQKDETMLALNMVGGLKEMTKEQKDSYSKDPSLLNAIAINYNSVRDEEIEKNKENELNEEEEKLCFYEEFDNKFNLDTKSDNDSNENDNLEENKEESETINDIQDLYNKYDIVFDPESKTYVNRKEDKPKIRSLNNNKR